jgi:ankyrin repeat protein
VGDAYTALAIAAAEGHHEVIPILVQSGANVNHKTSVRQCSEFDADRTSFTFAGWSQGGRTALMEGAIVNQVASVRALVEAGANLDLQDQVRELPCVRVHSSAPNMTCCERSK